MPYAATPKRKRKFDEALVKDLAKQGRHAADIARTVNAGETAISAYLRQVQGEIGNIQKYCRVKADTLALSQLKYQTIADLITDEWIKNPQKLKAADWRLQKEILVAVQGAKTYDFNSERLETGKSTGNIAVLINQIEALQE